jgi:hypothetical protein
MLVQYVVLVDRNGGDLCGNIVECWPVELFYFRLDEMLDRSSIVIIYLCLSTVERLVCTVDDSVNGSSISRLEVTSRTQQQKLQEK